MAGERAEDGTDDDRSAEAREDGIGDKDDEADDRAAGVCWPGARGDSEQRGDEVSADQPADDEVEGSQAPPVTGLGWYGVGDRRAAVPGCFDLRDDVLHGGRERGSTATGDEQRISLAAGVDDQHAAGGRASPQEGPADVLIGDGGGVERDGRGSR